MLKLIEHINGNRLFDKFQSGFRACHSTEIALLNVLNDIILATDNGQTYVLLLLDLPAAFDTVFFFLIKRLKYWVGISGLELDWFYSCLPNKKFCVTIGDVRSSTSHFSYGVPQGLVLGLFPLGLFFFF